MKAYTYDTSDPSDPRTPHDSGETISPFHLELLRVETFHFDSVDSVNILATQREYRNRDEITISPAAMGDAFEGKLRIFFQEHLHEDEEIRYIIDGEGYFDVRDVFNNDRWIRIFVGKGDLVILPKGIYHRFTVTEKNYIIAMRLFKEEPKWTPLNKAPDVDGNSHRTDYLNDLGVGVGGGA